MHFTPEISPAKIASSHFSRFGRSPKREWSVFARCHSYRLKNAALEANYSLESRVYAPGDTPCPGKANTSQLV